MCMCLLLCFCGASNLSCPWFFHVHEIFWICFPTRNCLINFTLCLLGRLVLWAILFHLCSDSTSQCPYAGCCPPHLKRLPLWWVTTVEHFEGYVRTYVRSLVSRILSLHVTKLMQRAGRCYCNITILLKYLLHICYSPNNVDNVLNCSASPILPYSPTHESLLLLPWQRVRRSKQLHGPPDWVSDFPPKTLRAPSPPPDIRFEGSQSSHRLASQQCGN